MHGRTLLRREARFNHGLGNGVENGGDGDFLVLIEIGQTADGLTEEGAILSAYADPAFRAAAIHAGEELSG